MPTLGQARASGQPCVVEWVVGPANAQGELAEALLPALERLPGVKRAEVSLEKAQARVEFEDTKISADKLAAAINQLGFQAKVRTVTPGRP